MITYINKTLLHIFNMTNIDNDINSNKNPKTMNLALIKREGKKYNIFVIGKNYSGTVALTPKKGITMHNNQNIKETMNSLTDIAKSYNCIINAYDEKLSPLSHISNTGKTASKNKMPIYDKHNRIGLTKAVKEVKLSDIIFQDGKLIVKTPRLSVAFTHKVGQMYK